jgi:hypothetical protein
MVAIVQMRFSMRFYVPLGVRECLSSGAPLSPALVCRSIKAMVRSCQCSSKVALSAPKSGPRVDAGLTREVENGKGSLGTRGNLLCGCPNDDRIRGCRATNAARHAGIGVPTHHKRTVTLRPPHEHRGGRALPRVGFESVRQVQKRLREEWCGRHAAMPGGVRIW